MRYCYFDVLPVNYSDSVDFCRLVRPVLEYGSSVLDPGPDPRTLDLQDELVKVQNRSAWFVTRNNTCLQLTFISPRLDVVEINIPHGISDAL